MAILRSLLQHLFVPVIIALVIAAWTFHDALERTLSAHAIRLDAQTFVLLGLIGCVWCAEAIIPARREWNYRLLSDGVRGGGRLAHDLFYLLFATQLTNVLLRWAKPHVTALAGSHTWWPSQAAEPLRVALAFLLVELLSYWVHRAAHRVPLLWRFHATHHVITELGALKSLRVHPVDNLVFYVGRTLPLLFLGASPDDLVTVAYLGGALGILSHANLDASPGWLGWIVNYPRYHSVHHSANLEESNSNFGCHTVLWDRLFRTFRPAPRAELVLGVEPVGPRSLWSELVRPFYGRTGP